MRGLIASALACDPEIEVVGEAADPLQARQAIKTLNPDVVTLDVEMPNMSGLEFLEKIMRLRPMPVIMVSTLTSRGAEETIKALEIGAVDCIEKPRPGDEHNFEELPFKVKIAASARVRPLLRDEIIKSTPQTRGGRTRTINRTGGYSRLAHRREESKLSSRFYRNFRKITRRRLSPSICRLHSRAASPAALTGCAPPKCRRRPEGC